MAGMERMLSTFVYGFAASEAGGRFAGLDIEAEFEYAALRIETLIEAVQVDSPPSVHGSCRAPRAGSGAVRD